MKKLLKVLLPPLTGFAVYFFMLRYNSAYFSLRIDEMGEGTLRAFMAFYKFLCPVFLIIALLTQLLIINPIWRNVINKGTVARLIFFTSLLIVCMLFAGCVTFTITDASDTGHHIFMLFAFMTSIQVAYWVVDIAVLSLLK